MGMQILDMKYAIEGKFQINLDDDVFEMGTLGNIYSHIVKKLNDSKRIDHEFHCPHPIIFYKIRRYAVESFGIPERQITLQSSVHDLIPVAEEKASWQKLQECVGFELPPLTRHPRIEKAMSSLTTIFACKLFIGLIIAFLLNLIYPEGYFFREYFLFIAIFIFFFILEEKLLRPYATHIPEKFATVRDVVKYVGKTYWIEIVGKWNEKKVWEALCNVIEEISGIPGDKLQMNMHIIHDLNLD